MYEQVNVHTQGAQHVFGYFKCYQAVLVRGSPNDNAIEKTKMPSKNENAIKKRKCHQKNENAIKKTKMPSV